MPNLYLKIVDIDRFEDTKVVDEKKATHVVEVDESDYADTVEMFNKYFKEEQPKSLNETIENKIKNDDGGW